MVLTLLRDITSSSQWFYVDELVALNGTPPTPFFIKINDEVMKVTTKNIEIPPTGRDYYIYWVTRGQNGSAPSNHAGGSKIKLLLEPISNLTRPLGIGSKELLLATSLDGRFGYYGKYKGIATPNELITLGGITEGTTKNDAYNNPNEDITWLKFSHNYKTLFVADRAIHSSVSWTHLDLKSLVFGKVVTIDGQRYLLRLLQGAKINPATASGGKTSNDEWDSLIATFTPNTVDSHWSLSDDVNYNSGGESTWVQETANADITGALIKTKVDLTTGTFDWSTKTYKASSTGYRPVLEVL